MAVDLKSATPDTTIPSDGFLFGADSQSASAPSVYPLSSLWQKLTGSTAFSGDTVTASKPLLDLAQTWNNAGVVFNGVKINITDTASNAASLLFDLQRNGSSQIRCTKDGLLTAVGGFSTSNYYAGYGTNNRLYLDEAVGVIKFFNGSNTSYLAVDAANTLALRNGTNAQRFNIASSWTDASNLSRAFIDAGQSSANVLFFGSEHLGTGGNALTKFQLNLDGATKLNYDITLPGGWYTPTAFMAGGLMIGAGFYGLPAASVALSTNNGSSALTLATGSATFNQPASAPTLRTSTAYTVAALPSAASAGAGTRAYVTDATSTTFMSVAAGGGANKVPVISDGADWRIA